MCFSLVLCSWYIIMLQSGFQLPSTFLRPHELQLPVLWVSLGIPHPGTHEIENIGVQGGVERLALVIRLVHKHSTLWQANYAHLRDDETPEVNVWVLRHVFPSTEKKGAPGTLYFVDTLGCIPSRLISCSIATCAESTQSTRSKSPCSKQE